MEYVTLPEAMRRAGVSEKTLRRAIVDGVLSAQPRQYHNQPIMLAVEDLEKYIQSRGIRPSREVAPVVSDVPVQATKVDTRSQAKIEVLEEKVIECLVTVKRLEERVQGLTSGGVQVDDLTEVLDRRYLHQDFVLDFEQRVQAIEKQLRELEAANDPLKEQREAFFARPGVQALVEREMKRLEEESSASSQDVQAPSTIQAPSYEGEWTITGANDAVVFHDADPQRARRRLETLASNSPSTRYHLHRPVFTPSSGLATEVTEGLPEGAYKQLKLSTGEVITFRDDFNTPLLVCYRCEAVHKDVDASLEVIPHRHSGEVAYTIGRTKWGKTNPVGREGPKQTKRAQTLLATLEDRTRRELLRAGWAEVGQTDEQTPVTLWRKLPENTRLM